ncbi:MAG: hypothetical protein RMJ19_08490, partial [Gemmatales bacterium]|nr:hypothetical protein [Gemmatales bacterium]MDW8175697.1 hypothetical protein [Gemmatales bacterium]
MDIEERKMRLRWGCVAIAVNMAMLVSLAGCGHTHAQTDNQQPSPSEKVSLPPLRWGADAEGGAPYIFYDPERPDQLIGFEVDLIRALERELGRRIE